LSFVPPDDVAECFNELNDNRPDELAPVYDYWEDNYIGRLRRRRWAVPTFPIALWKQTTCAVPERNCTQHRTLVSGGRERFILLDAISEQFTCTDFRKKNPQF